MNYYPQMPIPQMQNPAMYPPNPIPQNDYPEEEEEEERQPERDAFGILIKKSKKKKKKEKKEQNQPEKKKEAKKEEKKAAAKPKEQPKPDLKAEETKGVEEQKAGPPTEVKKAEEEEEELPAKYVEVDEKRMPISIVFIGHVDVGKSTICGNVMVITEKVDIRTIKKYELEAKEKKRESWWLAYVMDVNDDERQRGKTVEVGRATFVTETKRYTIYDAPRTCKLCP